MTFERSSAPEHEWVPLALRDSICTLRSRDPQRYAARLREAGVDVESGDVQCMHNLDGTWPTCPLFAARRARR